MSKKYHIDYEAYIEYKNEREEGMHSTVYSVDEEYLSEHIKNGKISEEECSKLLDRLQKDDMLDLTVEELLEEDALGCADTGVKFSVTNIMKIYTSDDDILYKSDVFYV